MNPPKTIAELTAHIEKMRECVDELPERFKPIAGWHTITVGSGYSEAAPGSIRDWLRLFDVYQKYLPGNLYWQSVPHFDHEKRQIAATFCIQ